MGSGLFWVRFIPQLNRGNMKSGGDEHISWFFQTDKKAEFIFKVFILLFADSHIGQMNFSLYSIRQLYIRERFCPIINYCL